MKPTVLYLPPALPWKDRAILIPITHYNHVRGQDAVNGREVTTSWVLSWDQETGVIETMNTVYKPLPDVQEDDELAVASDVVAGGKLD